MKVCEVRHALQLLSTVLDERKKYEVELLCRAFSAEDARAFSQFLRAAERLPLVPSEGSERIVSVVATLERIIPFASAYAKPAIAKDLKALTAVLAGHRSSSISDFVTAVGEQLKAKKGGRPVSVDIRDQVVAGYVKELEDSYKDGSAFMAVFDRLAADKNVRKQEAAAIASRFAHETAANTARPVSLSRVLQKHELYVSSAAKARAMAGRSAA